MNKNTSTTTKAKGWSVYYVTGDGWAKYEGVDEAMDITQPTTATMETVDTVYTLSGQKISDNSLKSKKGIYIIGGKKVIVK